MRKYIKKIIVCFMSTMLISSAMIVAPKTPFTTEAEAHSGRTDSHGGHKDNKNKSGLGYYHYHCGGHPPHLHEGGVCPYNTTTSTVRETVPAVKEAEVVETRTAETTNSGWQKDTRGWRCLDEHGECHKLGWKEIDGNWYCFAEDGYLLVNTTTPDGYQVDENGVWVKDAIVEK